MMTESDLVSVPEDDPAHWDRVKHLAFIIVIVVKDRPSMHLLR